MKPDERVTWLYRAPNGEVVEVPARLVRFTRCRAVVEVDQGEYKVQRLVSLDKLRRLE